MEGYRSALFSYGQTAAGKSFTLAHILASAFVITFQWFPDRISSFHYLGNLDRAVLFAFSIVYNANPFDILGLPLCLGLSEYTLLTFAMIGSSERYVTRITFVVSYQLRPRH